MHNVIEMKQQRWPFAGVDYTLVAKGELRLITEDSGRLAAIAEDHRIAIEGGMFFKEPDGFDKIIECLQQVQDEFNRAMKKVMGPDTLNC